METTKLFLITYFAAALGVVPPGLVNMSVAKACVDRGKSNGIIVAIGASVVVLFQALLAILLAKYIFNNTYVRTMLLRTGVVIFIIMAIYFFIMAKKKKVRQVKKPAHAGMKSFAKGLMLGILNVLPIPFFCALGGVLNVSGKVEYDVMAIGLFVMAAGLGTFTTLYFYAISFARVQRESTSFAKYSNYFMACLMIVLVIVTLIRTMYFE
ncbi:LysE family translocator [Croceiramulus getboli]|nr:LysE family transporter [Flavobacteriaceae bacterium YJPT1-3]